ncbi:unconventional myosin-Va-like [Schistocerca serialis cubense]|uniref:unconventional myosin-Va-like n=1 Tax=Schistocerca serialis cubense TaxID=2023355 RepID=UPI00214F5D27|nr:unconventional myosin-Va-like [Schistocerca serialis cubense]
MEKTMFIHADNCVGQNKNNILLRYLARRISNNKNKRTVLSFMPVGHTQFACDWASGLLKKRFRVTYISSIQEFADCIEKSTSTTHVNSTVAVGNEIGQVAVNTYDWLNFLKDSNANKVPHITKYNHFEFNISSKGRVHCKLDIDGNEFVYCIFPNDNEPTGFPAAVIPPCMTRQRKQYPFKNIRTYCKENYKDITCLEVGSECEPETQVSDSKDPDEEPEQTNIPVRENNALRMAQIELLEVKRKFDALRVVETEKKMMVALLQRKDEDLKTLKSLLENERKEKMIIINEKEHFEKEKAEEVERINKENLRLKAELDKLNERIKSNQSGAAVENLQACVELKRLMLSKDRDGYQKLLEEHNLLKKQNESLKNEMGHLQWHGHSKSTHQCSFYSPITVSAQDKTISGVSDHGEDDGGGDTILTVVSFLFSTSDCSGTATVVVDTTSASVACAAAVIGLVAQADSDVTEFDRDALQQLEVENRRLHANMTKLQLSFNDCCSNQTLDDGPGREELLKQYIQLQLEVDRWREECIQLHSILAKQTEGLKNVASINYGSHVHLINEVVQLVLAFEAQKKINRQLEDELHQEKNKWQAEREQLQQENEKLREENDNQHKLLSPSLTKSPQTQTEAFMQHEIIRVTLEKLVLQEKLDLAKEELSQCKNSLKLQTEVLKNAGLFSSKLDNNAETAENSIDEVLVKRQDQRNDRRGIRKKERHYQGIFEFHKEDIRHIVRHVIFELKPHISVTLLPGLSAYILFMCIRHADCQNDYEKVQLLLTATIYTIEKVTKKGHDDIDIMVLWLSNTVRLLHNLKQYSGDKTFQTENTSLQNEQCLQNFDLTEYREVLSDTAVEIYQSLAGHIQEKIQPLVVPAILEHEEISGLTSQIASGKRGRAVLSSWDSEPFLGVQKSLDALLQELNYIYKIMGNHGVDPELTVQIFRQVFYFICAISMNNLLLRKDLCHWSKGMQIRYNLSHPEQWCRDIRLQYTDVPIALQPIIQAAHLLQARKLDKDVQHVCNMCDKLSMLQATLLMDTKFMFPVRFPFNPSKIKLEDIEVPEVLNLPMLKKV